MESNDKPGLEKQPFVNTRNTSRHLFVYITRKAAKKCISIKSFTWNVVTDNRDHVTVRITI